MLQIAVDRHFRLASMGGKAHRPHLRYYPDVGRRYGELECSGDGPRLSAGATHRFTLSQSAPSRCGGAATSSAQTSKVDPLLGKSAANIASIPAIKAMRRPLA